MPIVTVNVTQQVAPTPETLQQSGALVSQGGTILSAGTSALLTQLSDLTPLLRGALGITSIVWSSGVATVTTAAPHGLTTGEVIEITVAGAVPAGYNGTYACTITGASAFTYALASNPGSETIPGTYTLEDVAELLSMATTFFGQGFSTPVFVLEFGPGTPNDGIAALSAYLTANPNTSYTPGAAGFYYVYLLPREWDGNANLLALIASYESTTARTYFLVTTTLATYQLYTTLMKNVVSMIEAPAMDAWPANVLTAVTEAAASVVGVSIALPQSGAGSYAPADVLTATGGTGTEPTFTVGHTQVVSAVIEAGGTGGTPGAVTLIGTSGTGTRFQATGTINGSGILTGPLTVTRPGSYSVNPTSLAVEPVTGGSLTGAAVVLIMGVLDVTITTAGSLTAIAPNPVGTTVSPSVGTGCELNIIWTAIEAITATTTTDHGVDVGEWFQIQGCTPVGYNGWHQALVGTTGSTLVYDIPAPIGAISILGTLEANIATSTGTTATEFSLASVMWNILHQQPSSTNKVPPFAFDFLFGVTPFPKQGLSALLETLKQAAVNTVQTGAEGGISNACLFWGTTMDGNDIIYWYSVDWMAITSDVNLANTVINGSNDPINPLYYSPNGIHRLQDTVVATAQAAVTVGLGNGQVIATELSGPDFDAALDAGTFDGKIVVNAVPYLPYLAANPGDYKIGRYAGLSVQYIPSRGFVAIVLNLNVTEIIVGL